MKIKTSLSLFGNKKNTKTRATQAFFRLQLLITNFVLFANVTYLCDYNLQKNPFIFRTGFDFVIMSDYWT